MGKRVSKRWLLRRRGDLVAELVSLEVVAKTPRAVALTREAADEIDRIDAFLRLDAAQLAGEV